MTRRIVRWASILLVSGAVMIGGCSTERNFGQDVDFLAQHTDTIILSSPDGRAKVVLAPKFQGRVMTSTARGDSGTSFGFIKDNLIESRTLSKGINAYGGEDRFWLGPEGGQFSIFFPPDAPEQTLAYWQTPPAIDTDPYAVVERDAASVSFRHAASLVNASGARFDLRIDRTVRLLDGNGALASLGVEGLSGCDAVAFESENTITNTGVNAWTADSGMLSIWILGMLKHSPRASVIVPLRDIGVSAIAPAINDEYFGKVPPDRLRLVQREPTSIGPAWKGEPRALVFKADGQFRSKIGVSPDAVLPVCGSYDETRGVLTIVLFTVPAGATDYVNSMWQTRQREPFRGDVLNSYNDGPSSPGASPFGPFYEIESSSPALGLTPGTSFTHWHRTIHVQGPKEHLDRIARTVLGVRLDQAAVVW